MTRKREFYINGAWVAPAVAHDFPVIDPSTEEHCATISLGSAADADVAVAAAKAAFPGWSQTPPAARLACVERILAVYERRAEDMSRAISLEMGAPIDMARRSQTTSGTWHIQNFITAFKAMEFIRPLGPHAPNDRIALEPIGVVGLITPWNWPMNQVTLKAIPALLAGCTMVLKPSEIAPLSSLVFAEIVDEAGGHVGPVVSQMQYDKIQGMIETGIAEGARLVAGGLGRPDGLNRGYFVRPTVFADVVPGMTIEREEIFGPVLSMIPFDTEDEAVRIANDTPYGLSNYVQSQDGARRNRLARQLRAGMVEMNGQSRGAGSPFGGVKSSGRAREGGHWGIEEFLEVKAISGWAAE